MKDTQKLKESKFGWINFDSSDIDEHDYLQYIKKRNDDHNKEKNSKPCLHEKCDECAGTGRKKDGNNCIHYISCTCKKCNPFSF